MNEHLSDNDSRWDDLPLPDAEEAWRKMELLLPKEKKRRVLLWWFWLLLIGTIAGLLIGGWFWLYSDNNSAQPGHSKEVTVLKGHTDTAGSYTINGYRHAPYNNHLPISKTDTNRRATIVSADNKKVTSPLLIQKRTSSAIMDNNSDKRKARPYHVNKELIAAKKGTKPLRHKNAEVKDDGITGPSILIQSNRAFTQKQKSRTDSSVAKKDTLPVKDTTSNLPLPSTTTIDSSSKKTKKKPSLIVSAGVGLQQTLTFNNGQDTSLQKSRTASLSDYIPTVYLKLQKGRWSLLADIGYKLPLPVNNLSFSRHTQYDAVNFTRKTEELFIQKLYYHQALLSLNYSLSKHLSIGAGGMYNILSEALTTNETTTQNLVTGEAAFSKHTVPVHGYTDSFFYQTTAGILVQGSYQINRFEAGVRYIKNLQPFIKYTTPTGNVLNNSNSSLQTFVRFRLWKKK